MCITQYSGTRDKLWLCDTHPFDDLHLYITLQVHIGPESVGYSFVDIRRVSEVLYNFIVHAR